MRYELNMIFDKTITQFAICKCKEFSKNHLTNKCVNAIIL